MASTQQNLIPQSPQKQMTRVRPRVQLKPTGPHAVGILKAATAVPPYKQVEHDPLKTSSVSRDGLEGYQGKHSEFTDVPSRR
jgi:hypothetical protein